VLDLLEKGESALGLFSLRERVRVRV